MYYSVSTLGSRDSVIGVASSPNLQPGSWQDHGGLFRSEANGPYNAIDANWISVGGKQVLVFGSYWNGIHTVDLKGPQAIADGAQANQIAYNSTGNHAIEAGFVFYRQGWYYLTFSSGQAADYINRPPAQGEEYRINVCRSRDATGGFVRSSSSSSCFIFYGEIANMFRLIVMVARVYMTTGARRCWPRTTSCMDPADRACSRTSSAA